MLQSYIENTIKWFKEQEQYILNNGESIPLEIHDFLNLHSSYNLIEKIKIMYVNEIPLPQEFYLYDKFQHQPRGLAAGNGIYIDKKYKEDMILLKHEVVHVIQYNRFKSIDTFIKHYIKEYLQYGYLEMPLEKEARIKSNKGTP